MSRGVVLLAIIAVLLMGCNGSVKNAKADAIRQQTRRTMDRHELAMAESEAVAPTRVAVKRVLWWSLMAGGVFFILSLGGASGIYLVGTSINTVRFHRVSLDVQTRQYPLLFYGNGRRVFNPNTGERLLLAENSGAATNRIEAQTRVQLAGLITDNSKIINGE